MEIENSFNMELPELMDQKPELVAQNEMDYIIAQMGLSQRSSEFLTSFF